MQSSTQFPHIKHLREFYSPEELFSDAQELPQFFLTNLVDDARVVKYFHQDPQANIKIFYYQYLKLCFEIDNVDYESYIEKIYELIRTEGFEFFFDHQDSMRQHKNAQYKSLLIDFFEIMNSSSMTIDIVLTQYPILKEVFTNFFRTVVMIASITPDFDSYIDKNELFDFLSSFFSVDISSYDKCLKFVQSDIFVYEQNQENIYMAYIKDDQGQVQQSYQSISGQANRLQRKEITTVKEDERESEVSNTTEDLQQSPTRNRVAENNRTLSIDSLAMPLQRVPDNNQKPRAKTIIKESYIEGQFADYTSFNNLSSFGKSLSGQVQREVLIECLQPNTTVNELSQESSRKTHQQLRELDQKELKRVQSADNNILLNAHIVNSVEIQDDSIRETHNFFARVVSNPNFLTSDNPTHKLAESYYDSAESKNQQAEYNMQTEQDDLQNSKTNRASGKSKTLKKNTMYVTFQQPTKDPGFAKQSIGDFITRPLESEMYNSHELTDFNQETLPMESKDSAEEKTQLKPLAKQPLPKPYTCQQPLFHKPSAQSPNFLSQISNGRTISSSNSQKDQFNYNSATSPLSSVLTTPLAPQKFRLNVTKEFTNSIVMKSMTQPFKSNVYQTRERARQFRKNIYKKFTYQSVYQQQKGSTNFLSKKPFSRVNLASESTIENTFSSNNLLRAESNYLKEKQQSQYTTPITLIKAGHKVDTEERRSVKVQQQSKVSEVKETKSQLNKTPTNTGTTQQLNTSQIKANISIYQPATQAQSKLLPNPAYQPIKSSPAKTTQPNPTYNNQYPTYLPQNPPYHQQNTKTPQTYHQPQYQPYNQSHPQPHYQPQIQPYVPYSSHNCQNITGQHNNGRIQNSQAGIKTIPQVSLLSNMSQPQKPYPQYVPFERKK